MREKLMKLKLSPGFPSPAVMKVQFTAPQNENCSCYKIFISNDQLFVVTFLFILSLWNHVQLVCSKSNKKFYFKYLKTFLPLPRPWWSCWFLWFPCRPMSNQLSMRARNDSAGPYQTWWQFGTLLRYFGFWLAAEHIVVQ